MSDIIMSVLVMLGVLAVLAGNILLARENWHRH
jgi:hypothetical protein